MKKLIACIFCVTSAMSMSSCRDEGTESKGKPWDVCPKNEERIYDNKTTPEELVDTTNDALNCGACGVVCALDDHCVSSVCTPDCEKSEFGSKWCAADRKLDRNVGRCVDLTTDFWNCGSCGNFCSLGVSPTKCYNGRCLPAN